MIVHEKYELCVRYICTAPVISPTECKRSETWCAVACRALPVLFEGVVLNVRRQCAFCDVHYWSLSVAICERRCKITKKIEQILRLAKPRLTNFNHPIEATTRNYHHERITFIPIRSKCLNKKIHQHYTYKEYSHRSCVQIFFTYNYTH